MRAIRAVRATHTIRAVQAVRATQAVRTTQATRARNERVEEGPAGATSEPRPAVQATLRARGLPTGAPAEPHPLPYAPEREKVERASARVTARAHLWERLGPVRSGDATRVAKLVGRLDSVGARGAAYLTAASLLTVRRAGQLTVRRTAQPAGRRNARVSAGALILPAQRAGSYVRSEYAWGKVMGDASGGPGEQRGVWQGRHHVTGGRHALLMKTSAGGQGVSCAPSGREAMRRGWLDDWAGGWRTHRLLGMRGGCERALTRMPCPRC